ncbi:FAD binding domain-containing protein [Colletotrichum higginsianum IMI 349063]|uniref:FAD binding domain-containing protein n=3 Tax=Colletotrichum higginsianum TaxID=80884 RepID=A0A1B7XXX7_COLHI|nr:FAD binding domain-containing protein [Colletotrichum higginsianum IMI 349063]OBR04627.1 FAD binding domain-containing protein [Colletotrichum higginsianum IMI 349063]TIC93710.1 FAD-linked oxidoreductase patO [Colletotrichum higginsianum]
MRRSPFLAPLALAGAVGSASAASLPSPSCKYLPGDPGWPSADAWAQLNRTVDGRLVATVPLGSACHGDGYNATECARLQDAWLYSEVHMESSSSVMAPLFANASCDPFTPRDVPCALGNYVSYAVDASGPADVQAALRFADQHNVRLVVRNTGHDYNGRSTGAGALAVWTHHLKGAEIIDWDDGSYYVGKALRAGAGVQGFEAIAAADAAGLAVVTGECPTVGIAGGYVQGGGHSALSTVYGLAADNTLSFEVVTPTGDLVTASRTQNEDLYWALSGGGGGNYGVVTSITTKAHPDAPVSGATFAVTIPEGDNNETLYRVIDAFHAALPDIVDAGVMIIYFFGPGFLQSPALTAYNKTRADVERILAPLVGSLAQLNVTLEPTYTSFDTYRGHYNHYWGPLPSGNIQVGTQLFGGRLLPRAVLPSFGPTARRLVELGVTYIGVGLDVSRFGRDGANAVLPQWRDSIVQVSLTLPWSFEAPFADMLAEQDRMTEVVQPVIEAATPGAGAYINEADFQQKDWQETFFGANYPRLLRVKNKYDPAGLLYNVAAVGSDAWNVDYHGRMCRRS